METWIETVSPAETRALAAQIGAAAPAGTVIAARGAMGLGKTVFAQGLARGLQVAAEVTSPTYLYFEEYAGRLPFCHIDAYRLADLEEEELALIGLEECFLPRKLAYVEWPEYLVLFLPADTVLLDFQPGATAEARRLCFTYQAGPHAWLAEILKNRAGQ